MEDQAMTQDKSESRGFATSPLDRYHRLVATSRLLAALLAAGLTPGTIAHAARAAPAPTEPFKVAKIHFETNASACDMGPQIAFDTEGITSGSVSDPKGRKIYSFQTKAGMRATGGQTEGFLETVEPQITELLSALGCEPSDEAGVVALDDLFEAWPSGDYTFEARAKGARIRSQATLTHLIPAGPEVVAPADGTVLPAAGPVVIEWSPVTEPILPELGPVNIVGYHILVEENTGAEVTPTIDVDVSDSETSLTVPPEYLKPATVYRFEVLSTEESGNQTITEGFFCTEGVAECAILE
jgi:hypothetical protein